MSGEEAILARLEGLSERVGRMDERQREDWIAMRVEISDVRVAIAGLKVKAGVWGALAGLIPATLALFLIMVKFILAGE
jgi:hypothetical protein